MNLHEFQHEETLTHFNPFQSIVPFLSLPKKTFSGKTEKGNNILKWIKERAKWSYNVLLDCVWIWKQKLFQRYSNYCFQLLNTIKLHSVFFMQYSQHKFKNVSRKSKSVRRKISIYASATKVFKKYNFSCEITSLLSIN